MSERTEKQLELEIESPTSVKSTIEPVVIQSQQQKHFWKIRHSYCQYVK
jgi:hypothetical protein